MQNIGLCYKIISLSSTVTSCNSHIREGTCVCVFVVVGYMAKGVWFQKLRFCLLL
jgi:hypothetical protein